jgi:xanthine dehydrogenase accessory factor
VLAPLSGRVRGLVHDGAQVSKGAKLVEIDPRGEAAQVYGLGERPKRIAAGVLRAVQAKRR